MEEKPTAAPEQSEITTDLRRGLADRGILPKKE